MKTLKLNALIISSLTVLFAASCKKYEEPMVAPPQNVVSSILDSLAGPVHIKTAATNYSVGYQFIPAVSGKITQLSINLPKAGDYKISIWDVDTQTLLTQTTVEQVYGNWAVKDIPELSVQGQKTYAISFLLPTTDYYYVENVTLPMNMDNINILNSVATLGDEYPVVLEITDHLYGFVDFTFQADPQ